MRTMKKADKFIQHELVGVCDTAESMLNESKQKSSETFVIQNFFNKIN